VQGKYLLVTKQHTMKMYIEGVGARLQTFVTMSIYLPMLPSSIKDEEEKLAS
jgi:hypothetical protein